MSYLHKGISYYDIQKTEPDKLIDYFFRKIESQKTTPETIERVIAELQTESANLKKDFNDMQELVHKHTGNGIAGIAYNVNLEILSWIGRTYNDQEFEKLTAIILESIIYKMRRLNNKVRNGKTLTNPEQKFIAIIENINSCSNTSENTLKIILNHLKKDCPTVVLPIRELTKMINRGSY